MRMPFNIRHYLRMHQREANLTFTGQFAQPFYMDVIRIADEINAKDKGRRLRYGDTCWNRQYSALIHRQILTAIRLR